MFRKSKVLALLVILALAAAAVSAQANADLVAAAKKEGKVVVYSITSRISNAAAAFEKKDTGSPTISHSRKTLGMK